jgi:hypothetical protein
LRAESPGESGARGVASGSSEAVAPKSTALPQEGQKRAVPGTALPQSGQVMIAAQYITARFQVQALEISGTRVPTLTSFYRSVTLFCYTPPCLAPPRGHEILARIGESNGRIQSGYLSRLSRVWQLGSSQVTRPRNLRTRRSARALQTCLSLRYLRQALLWSSLQDRRAHSANNADELIGPSASTCVATRLEAC